MSLGKRILRGAIWNHLGRIIEYGLMYFLSVLIARKLGPEGNGIYAQVLSVVQLLLVFSSFGLETSVTSSLPRLLSKATREEAVGAFRGLLAFRVGCLCFVGLLFLLLRGFAAQALRFTPAFVDLFFIFVLYFAMRSVVSLLSSVHIARLNTPTVAVVTIPVRILEVLAAWYLLSLGCGLREIFFLLTTTSFAQGLGLAFFIKDFFFSSSSRAALRPMISVGGKFWISGLMEFILGKQADVLLLSIFLIGPLVIGIYDVAMSFAQVINFGMTTGLYGISVASFASVAAGNEKLVPRYWESLSRAVVIAVVPAFVFAIFFADILLPAIYSPAFQSSAVFFQIYAACLIGTRLLGGGIAADYFQAAGKTRVLLLASAVSGGINLFLAFLLIPRFGALGAVYATGIAALVIAGIHGFCLRKILKVHFPFTFGFSIIVCSAVSAILTKSLGWNIAGENLVVLLVVYAIFFVVISYIVKPLVYEDIDLLHKLGERPFRFARLFARPHAIGSHLDTSEPSR
jgi:O-antigen/teichoic acid export membrane protein